MHTSINIANDSWSLAPFPDAAALRGFYEAHGCDGLELILCGNDFSKLRPGMVRGLHLVFYPEWIALWHNDFAYLDREFGSRKAWHAFYGARNADGLLANYRRELETARWLGAEYVVFHMGDNALAEYYHLRPRYSAEEQADASCRFLNRLLGQQHYPFALLLENMWLGCMNLTRPDITRRILAQIRHPNKGLMLDTGHLMCTSPTPLEDPGEACAYIHRVLDAHEGLLPAIRGVHLHASLSGGYLAGAPWPVPDFSGMDYIARYSHTNTHLRRVDPHRPFTADGLPALMARLSPEYLCYELSRDGVDDWSEKLRAQHRALHPPGENG